MYRLEGDGDSNSICCVFWLTTLEIELEVNSILASSSLPKGVSGSVRPDIRQMYRPVLVRPISFGFCHVKWQRTTGNRHYTVPASVEHGT